MKNNAISMHIVLYSILTFGLMTMTIISGHFERKCAKLTAQAANANAIATERDLLASQVDELRGQLASCNLNNSDYIETIVRQNSQLTKLMDAAEQWKRNYYQCDATRTYIYNSLR